MINNEERKFSAYDRGFSPNRWLIGILVIGVGLLLLGQNTGFLHLNIDIDWWRLWPILIIFLGLSMLRFKSTLANIVSFLIVLAVIAAISFMVVKTGMVGVKKQSSQDDIKIQDFIDGTDPFGMDGAPRQFNSGPTTKS